MRLAWVRLAAKFVKLINCANQNVVQSKHNNIFNNVKFCYMFQLQVTIIRQTSQYMDMTCSVLKVWDPILIYSYICCVEFRTFRLINCSIFNILTNVFSEIIQEPINVRRSVS